MAFPVVDSQVLDTHVESNNTTINVNINFTTRNVGDLVIIVVTYDGEATMTWSTSGGTWTAITNAAGLDGSGDQRTEARYRIMTGSEGTTETITSTSDCWCAYAIRITGHDAAQAPVCTAATGTSGNVDPPSLSPSWGLDDTLWVAYATVASGDATVTAGPSIYTFHDGDNSGSGTGGVAHGIASLGKWAASENPGTFTNTSGGWRSLTFGIKPGAADATIAVAKGALALATLAYRLVVHFAPTVGAIMLTGLAPTVRAEQTIAAGAPAAVIVTGPAPAASTAVTVPAGSLTATGRAPLAVRGITVPAGALVVTGCLPVSASTGTTMMPVGALVWTGPAPSAGLGITVAPGAVVVTGTSAITQLGFIVDVDPATVLMAGSAPSVTQTGNAIEVAAGALTLTLHQPTLAATCQVPAGAVIVTGQDVEVSTAGIMLPDPAVVTVTGLAPTAQLRLYAAVPAGALTWQGFASRPFGPYVSPWVSPAVIRIEVALGPSFENTVLADNPLGFWRLGEVWGTVAYDWSLGTLHNGTYVGDPALFAPAAVLDGNHSCAFNGEPEHITMGDVAAFEFTGACTIEFWMKLLALPDAEAWAISKYATATTTGWYVSVTTAGFMRFVMRNAAGSADAFNVQTAVNLADETWHHVACTWDGTTAADGVTIYIDGAISGQGTASTASVSTANSAFVIAKRDDDTAYLSNVSLDEIAVYAVALSQAQLETHLNSATVWTDISSDLIRSHGIVLDYGMGGRISDRVARTGTLEFMLRNDVGNSGGTLGWYSPHHRDCRSGWNYNIPTRLVMAYKGETYYWRGTLDTIEPFPGSKRERMVRCVAVDWMDDAARTFATLPIQIQKRGDEIALAMIGQMKSTPLLTDFQAGLDVYPYAVDNVGAETRVRTILEEIAMSGLEFIGQRRDKVGGQTVFFENRQSRLFDTTVLITLDETMRELEMGSSRSKVTNSVRVTTYPRRVGTDDQTVIATLLESTTEPATAIVQNQSVVYWLDYTDPVQRDSKIGGTEQQDIEAGTDYQMWSNADGTGSNLTANFTVTTDVYASGVRIVITNTAATPGYITKLQLRGKGIYSYNSVRAESIDADSVKVYGEQAAHISMPYQNDPNVGFAAATYLMQLYSNPLVATRSVSFYANSSDELMVAALEGDISDRVGLSESLTGIDAVAFHIHGIKFEISAHNNIKVTWQLAPSSPEVGNVWILEHPDSELGVNTVLGSL